MPTLTVKQSGGDYTTLAAAVTAATAGDIIEISGTWSVDDTAAVTVAVNNLDIKCTGDSKHPGYVMGTPTYYRLRVNANSPCIMVGTTVTGTIIDNLEIRQANTGIDGHGINWNEPTVDSGTLTVKNCLIYASSSNAGQRGIRHQNNDYVTQTLNVENCILWGWGRAGIMTNTVFGTQTPPNCVITANINSCTIYNCGHADLSQGYQARRNVSSASHTVNLFNCVIVDNYIDIGMTGNALAWIIWKIYNCIVSDLSIDDINTYADYTGSGNLQERGVTDTASPGAGNWVIFRDKTTAPYDLRLLDNATDNDAQDMHTSGTGGDLTMVTADIVGTTRPQNTNYDCGAFEVAVVSGPATPTNLQGTPTANSILWSWEAG